MLEVFLKPVLHHLVSMKTSCPQTFKTDWGGKRNFVMRFLWGNWPYFGHIVMFKLPPKLSSLKGSHFVMSILCIWARGELVCSLLFWAALTEIEVTWWCSDCRCIWCLGRMIEISGVWLGIISACIYSVRLAWAFWQHGGWDLKHPYSMHSKKPRQKCQGFLSLCLRNPRNLFPRNVLLLHFIGQSNHEGRFDASGRLTLLIEEVAMSL